MQRVRRLLGVVYISGVLAASLLFLDASKYDTADRVWMSLALGVGIVLLPLLFGFEGLRRTPLMTSALTGWIMWTGVALVFSHTKNYGFTEVVVLAFAALLGICVIGLERVHRKKLLAVVMVIAVLASLYGFWYFPTHKEPRMAGFFLDAFDVRHFFPNAFANFLLMVWPLGLLITGAWRGVKKPLTLGILLSALYFTFSRGSWIVFVLQVVALVVYEVLQKKERDARKLLTVGVGTFVIAGLIIFGITQARNVNYASPSLKEKITFKNNEAATSVNERAQFWKGSLALIKEQPIVGYGPMSFRYAYPPHQPTFLALSDHPHNWFLKIGAETGVPALVFFGIFLAGILAITWQHKKDFETIIFAVAFFGGLLHNMLDYNMNFVANIVLFFLLAGFIVSMQKEVRRNEQFNKNMLLPWLIIIIAVAGLSARELYLTWQLHEGNTKAYAQALAPRDYFRGEGARSEKLLNIHLSRNPLDAYAWELKGDYARALAVDPMNHFSYYRKYLQATKNPPPDFIQNLKKLLASYEPMITHNIHYTIATDNPEEAAKIYEILGDKTAAAHLRTLLKTTASASANTTVLQKDYPKRAPLDFLFDIMPRLFNN